MPYTHKKEGNYTCVYKKDDGTKVGCTKGDVNKYLAALHINEDIVSGGLADKMSVSDIAKKHKVSSVTIEKEIRKGIGVELEHTDDEKLAREIAKDHMVEDPKYYTKLIAMEETKFYIGKLLNEEIKRIK